MDRVPTTKPLSPMQTVVASLLGLGLSHEEVREELHVSLRTVRYHLNEAAKRIPGDLPAESRVVAWVRGASIDVLEGRTLRFEVMRDGQKAAATSPALTSQ
jgi:ATP/maltotriose-dependent transcriptional regulator MalT